MEAPKLRVCPYVNKFLHKGHAARECLGTKKTCPKDRAQCEDVSAMCFRVEVVKVEARKKK
jgi:hypothetical protein